MLKKIILLLVFAITIIPMNVMAFDDGVLDDMLGCQLVEDENGQMHLVCEEPEYDGIEPCYIPCTIDCWDDE